MGSRTMQLMVDNHAVGSLGREGCVSLDTSKGAEVLRVVLPQSRGLPPTIDRVRFAPLQADRHFIWTARMRSRFDATMAALQ
ncbi:MAG: hypothetical protein GC151_18540 [Betaproteobacteria bacterium]|nr:hypothetical protein [Betaproteobacteria bacterium]